MMVSTRREWRIAHFPLNSASSVKWWTVRQMHLDVPSIPWFEEIDPEKGTFGIGAILWCPWYSCWTQSKRSRRLICIFRRIFLARLSSGWPWLAWVDSGESMKLICEFWVFVLVESIRDLPKRMIKWSLGTVFKNLLKVFKEVLFERFSWNNFGSW